MILKNIRETLAVADDFCIYTAHRRYGHRGFYTLAELLEMMESERITHMWIMAGTDISERLSYIRDLPEWNIAKIGAADHYEFLCARRKEARADWMLYVCFVGYSRWPWKDRDMSAKMLFQTVALLEQALGLPLEWTPAYMSLRYVRKLNSYRWHWWKPVTLDLENPPTGEKLSYKNDIAKELYYPARGQDAIVPPDATHLVTMDGNSDYAAAMIGLNVGEGNPEWSEDSRAYDGKRPGFWRVDVTCYAESWYAGLLNFEDRKWMSTDLIEQCKEAGMHIEIEKGWYWKEYHQSLRSTAKILWDLRTEWRERAELSDANKNVYETIRQIIKAIHGKMGSPDVELHFRRRDIWALVVSRAVALRVRKLHKIYKEYGVLPVRIKEDEFRYAVGDEHLFDGMLGVKQLGGFKLVSCESVSEN